MPEAEAIGFFFNTATGISYQFLSVIFTTDSVIIIKICYNYASFNLEECLQVVYALGGV